MQLECALFITVVVGMACAIIAALSSLFWHSPDLKPHEKRLLSNWKRLKKAKTVSRCCEHNLIALKSKRVAFSRKTVATRIGGCDLLK
jgi:hypothetical protein